MTGRGLRGRRLARLMLFATVLADLFAAFLFVARPNDMGPMMSEPPPIAGWLVPVIGVVIHVIGFAWMIRIYRADPEGHASSWRSSRS